MTEKQAIFQALEQAILHSAEPMGLSDPDLPDNPMVVVNAAFEKLTGYAAADVVGRNCRFLQGAPTDRSSSARIAACLASGNGCIEWIVNQRRDGSTFWNLLFISPVRDAAGRVLFFFANQMDAAAGLPERLAEFPLGRAHMSAATEAEFHVMLQQVIDASASPVPTPRSLDAIVAAARRMSVLSTQLDPGTVDDPG